jgi:hypothetical protein
LKTTRRDDKPEVSTNLETVKMTIAAEGIDYLMHNLTNLYSDPITAVVREYVSNAIDSHVRAGQVKPVEVSTPDQTNGSIIVRDFGVGLSKDEIANVYSRYGLSTKNGNNDEIGGFGLGCKSALAITDRFDIVSVKDGYETIAYIQKNNKGVGVVHFVSNTPTTSPNSTTITIPVEGKLASRMSHQEAQTLLRGLNPGLVVVNASAPESVYGDAWTVAYNAGTRAGSYRKWNYGRDRYSNKKTIIATIGGVVYDIESFKRHSPRISNFFYISNYETSVDLPIGSVDLTPSREAIMENPRSIATLENAIALLEESIVLDVEARINQKETLKEAVEAFKAEADGGFWVDSVSYRGIEVSKYVKVENGVYKAMRYNGIKTKTATVDLTHNINTYELFNLVPSKTGANLVVEVDSPSNETAFDVAKHVYYYSMSKFDKEYINAFIVNSEMLEANPYLKEAATQNKVSFIDLETVAKAYRSSQRAKAVKGETKKTEVMLPVYKVSNGDQTVRPTAVSSLKDEKNAYIYAGSRSILTNIFPTLGWHYNNGGAKLWSNSKEFIPFISKAMQDYNLVFIPSNRNLDSILAMLPGSVDAKDLVINYAKELLSENRQHFINAEMLNRSYGNRSMRALMSLRDAIINEGQLQYLEAVELLEVFNKLPQNNANYNDYAQVKRVYDFDSEPEFIQEVNEYAEKVQSLENKYPLIFNVNNLEAAVVQHLVKYINIIK